MTRTSADAEARLLLGKFIIWGLIIGLALVLGRGVAKWDPKMLVMLFIFCVTGILAFSNTKLVPVWVLSVRSLVDVLIKAGVGFGAGGNLGGLMGIALNLVAFAYLMYQRGRILRSPVVVPYLLFLGIQLITFQQSISTITTVVEFMRALSSLMLFLLILETVSNPKELRRVLYVIVFSALIPCLYGLVGGFLTGKISFSSYSAGMGISGTFINRTVFSQYLMVIIMAFTGVIGFVVPRRRKYLWAYGALLLLCMLLTFARASWVGLLVSISVLVWFRKRKWFWVIPIAVVGIYFLIPAVHDRFADLMNTGSVANGQTSLETRKIIWKFMWPEVYQKPFLGHGAGVFEVGSWRVMGWYIAAHDDYLRIAYETGFVGLGLFVLYELTMLGHVFSIYLKSRNANVKALAVSTMSVIIAFFLIQRFDNIAVDTVLQWYLWGLYACTVKAWNFDNQGRNLVEEGSSPISSQPNAWHEPLGVART